MNFRTEAFSSLAAGRPSSVVRRPSRTAHGQRTTGNEPLTADHGPRTICRWRGRRGFNFTEILFAVMILGIGFIMIAAIFPSAIQQSRATGEETVASTAARGAINYLQKVCLMPPLIRASAPDSPEAFVPRTDLLTKTNAPKPADGVSVVVPGKVVSFRDFRIPDDAASEEHREALWNAVKGNMILASDRSVAWVPMYRRDAIYTGRQGQPTIVSGAPYVQVFVVVVQARNRTMYQLEDPTSSPRGVNDVWRYPDNKTTDPPATLEPALVTATLKNPGVANGTVDYITFEAKDRDRVAEGTVVIVSDDRAQGTYNGRIYRIGNPVGDAGTTNTWELAPGTDMVDAPKDKKVARIDPEELTDARVFIIGRGLTDPTKAVSSDNPYTGVAQDVAVYTSYLQAN